MPIDPLVSYSDMINYIMTFTSPLPFLFYALLIITLIIMASKHGIPTEIMIILGVLLFMSMVAFDNIFKPLTYLVVVIIIAAIVIFYVTLGRRGE
jgi:hypothetical protein